METNVAANPACAEIAGNLKRQIQSSNALTLSQVPIDGEGIGGAAIAANELDLSVDGFGIIGAQGVPQTQKGNLSEKLELCTKAIAPPTQFAEASILEASAITIIRT